MDVLAAIRAQREEIAGRIASLKAEDADLAVAERVVARFAPVRDDDGSPSGKPGQPPRQTDLIVSALSASRSSWVADWSALQKSIYELFTVEIPKSSLQPYLSNMKNEGIIVRDGPRIALRARVERGAGPNSDNSYDPNTAAVEEDDEAQSPLTPSAQSLARIRAQAEAVRRDDEAKRARNAALSASAARHEESITQARTRDAFMRAEVTSRKS